MEPRPRSPTWHLKRSKLSWGLLPKRFTGLCDLKHRYSMSILYMCVTWPSHCTAASTSAPAAIRARGAQRLKLYIVPSSSFRTFCNEGTTGFYTKRHLNHMLLHQNLLHHNPLAPNVIQSFTPNAFYTTKPHQNVHQKGFCTRNLLTPKAFIPQSLYMRTFLQQGPFHAQHILHQKIRPWKQDVSTFVSNSSTLRLEFIDFESKMKNYVKFAFISLFRLASLSKYLTWRQ